MKLNYGLRPGEKNQTYRVETYIFLPRVLGFTSVSYPPSRFYSDTSTFIRMTTPKVPLSELSEKAAIRPWSSDIKEQIDRFAEGNKGDIQSAEQGLKLLGCVFKSAVRDAHIDMRSAIESALNEEDWKAAAKKLERFTEDLRTALNRLHNVGERSNRDGVPQTLREGWQAIDEYASLLAEESITDLVSLCDENTDSQRLGKALDEARDLAIEQYRHRREQGWSSFATEEDNNEHLPRRWRIVKRYVSSALYLDVARDSTGRLANDLIGMGAAAAAMLFATLSLLLIQDRWGVSLSATFITAMVLSYVIKDRIKEQGKRIAGRRLRQFLSDHIVHIHGQSGAEVGTAKESFLIRGQSKVPADVRKLRLEHLDTHDAIHGRPETVLSHIKEVQLSSEALTQQFAGATGLTDVVRLSMQPMMSRMDDAWEFYRYIHPRTRELLETRCARIYHVNVVIKLIEGEESSSIHRLRAVVNKKGILRVEQPSGSSGAQHSTEAEETARFRILDD